MNTLHLRTKIRTSSSDRSLVNTIKPKAEYGFDAASNSVSNSAKELP
jgi:hypothetical protein